MEFYVRTRGDDLDQGYRWVKVLADGRQEPHDPPIASDPEASKLIYGEDFSVLLVRSGEELTLQVTGLPIRENSQRKRQNVQNILACVGTTADERILRGIAIAALREDNLLANVVDQHVLIDPESPVGFRISQQLPECLMSMRASGVQSGSDGEERIGTDIDTYRKILVEELDTFALPEKRTGTLVVVTRHRSHDVLQRAKVWRGVSDIVAESVPPREPRPPISASSAAHQQSSGNAVWIVAGVVAVVLTIMGVMLIAL